MKNHETTFWVYADGAPWHGTELMGLLKAQSLRGKEVFSFEYHEPWLDAHPKALFLDPNLGLYKGQQYLPDDQVNFGIFLDSSPDRWGRLLMRRREAWQAKLEKRPEKTLLESDYLAGVYDGHRLGALRFKLNPEGAFIHNQDKMATPPWTSLRELEYASLQLEKADAVNDPDYNKWLSLLVDPGSSLGGARPKASVADEFGHLWIAKFPSTYDQKNTGAWEMTLNLLAKSCGIIVPEARLHKFNSRHHTFLSKRFDRTAPHKRLHFASAMTLLGQRDGTDHADGLGYLNLVAFILQHSPSAKKDLEQLWRRLVFNLLVSNTDDHLRNHGFVLRPNGWRLSPAFDMNPNELGQGLTLNISENSNAQDLDLAMQTAPYYHLRTKEAEKMMTALKNQISNWRQVSRGLGIPRSEIDDMSRAFRLS